MGSDSGGAQECLKVTDGYYAPQLSRAPMRCAMGQQPNNKHDDCEPCPSGEFNPVVGELCRTCPNWTYPNKEKTACLLYDQIVDSNGTLW